MDIQPGLCPKPRLLYRWFLYVTAQLCIICQANREQLDEYLALLESARNDDKHADAVIWKFCDLDVDPEDR